LDTIIMGEYSSSCGGLTEAATADPTGEGDKGPLRLDFDRRLAANAVRLQLLVLAYNQRNFMRTQAITKAAAPWSLTSLHGEADQDRRQGCQSLQMAEVAVSRQLSPTPCH
jgi:hypothetical protein